MAGDLILEERVWRSGVEIVSRVNWTHLGHVRRSLGIGLELGARQSRRSRRQTWSQPSVSRAFNATILAGQPSRWSFTSPMACMKA